MDHSLGEKRTTVSHLPQISKGGEDNYSSTSIEDGSAVREQNKGAALGTFIHAILADAQMGNVGIRDVSHWVAFEKTSPTILKRIQEKSAVVAAQITQEVNDLLPSGHNFHLRLSEIPFQNSSQQLSRLVKNFSDPDFKDLLSKTTLNLPNEYGTEPVSFENFDDFFAAILTMPYAELKINGTTTALKDILDSDARLQHPHRDYLRFISDMYSYSSYLISDESNIGTEFEGVQFLNALCVARPDTLVFSCKDGDPQAVAIIQKLSSVVQGNYFGRKQLMDITELAGDNDTQHLIPDNDPPLHVFRQLLDLIDLGQVKMTLVELKTSTVQYKRINGELKKVSFDKKDVPGIHLADIAHTLEAFRSFISITSRASHLQYSLRSEATPLDPNKLTFNYDPKLVSDHLNTLSSAHTDEESFQGWQKLVDNMNIILARFYWPIVDQNNLIVPQAVEDKTMPQHSVNKISGKYLEKHLKYIPRAIVKKIRRQNSANSK